MLEEPKMVWVYTGTNHQVGYPDHLKVFATPKAADEWFQKNDPQWPSDTR
jgi:hypothetical protein